MGLRGGDTWVLLDTSIFLPVFVSVNTNTQRAENTDINVCYGISILFVETNKYHVMLKGYSTCLLYKMHVLGHKYPWRHKDAFILKRITGIHGYCSLENYKHFQSSMLWFILNAYLHTQTHTVMDIMEVQHDASSLYLIEWNNPFLRGTFLIVIQNNGIYKT